MNLIRWWSAAVLGVMPIACASDRIAEPPRGFAHAAASSACGPADGPAIAIYLTSEPVTALEPATPFVRVYVAQPLSSIGGKVWIVGGNNADGAAWFHSSASDYEIATSGYMTVKSVAADNTIEGNVDIAFPSAGHVRGGFHAMWLPTTVLCG